MIFPIKTYDNPKESTNFRHGFYFYNPHKNSEDFLITQASPCLSGLFSSFGQKRLTICLPIRNFALPLPHALILLLTKTNKEEHHENEPPFYPPQLTDVNFIKTLLRCLPLAAMLLTMVSCTQELGREEPADDALPQGEYPVLFSVAQPGGHVDAETRVTGTDAAVQWKDNDQIAVCIKGHPEKVGIYTLDANGLIKADQSTPIYWQSSKRNQELIAWYPVNPNDPTSSNLFTVSLTNQQEEGTVYLMHATTTVSDISKPATLEFKQLLSKVQVKPTEEPKKVEIEAIGDCQFNPITGIITKGTAKQSIPLSKNGNIWEAVVLPGETISKVRLNESQDANINPAITAAKGNVHNIDLKIRKVIDLNKLTDDYMIQNEEGGEYIVRGSCKGHSIVINSSKVKLTLQGVTIESSTPIYIKSGSEVELCNENTSTFTTTAIHDTQYNFGVSILVEKGCTATITGSGTLIANYKDKYHTTGIGCGMYPDCGKIIIDGNLTVRAYGTGYAPAIGAATSSSCDGIEILGGTVEANIDPGSYKHMVAIGGNGGDDYYYNPPACEYIKLRTCKITITGGSDSYNIFLAKSYDPHYLDLTNLEKYGVTVNLK